MKHARGSDLIIVKMDGAAGIAAEALKSIKQVDGVEAHDQELTISVGNGAALLSAVALALNQQGIDVQEITLRTPTLDDVFLQVTGERLQDGASAQQQALGEIPIPARCIDWGLRTGGVRMGRLDGKVAIISGGARGQGAAEAKLFAREGAKLVLGDILDEDGQNVESVIRELGGEATYVHLDVAREDDWHSAVGMAVNRYGKLDILVNNAGILIRRGIEDTTEEVWDRIMEINAKGVFLGTKHAIPAMRQAEGGSIINISSTAGLVADPGGGSASYTASKGAVRLLTKATAIQYAKEGIRCNSVHPGPIDTDMIRDTLTDHAMVEERMKRIPLSRVGTAEDVAYGVLFLASDESSFVTGSELVIDGGMTAQ